MNKNTVILDVEKYNELRDFKKEIESGKKLRIIYYSRYDEYGSGYGLKDYEFFTENEIIKELNKSIENLCVDNNKLSKSLKIANERLECYPQPKQVTLEDIKKMNWFEFRKWKKENK